MAQYNVSEEEIKARIASDYFGNFDYVPGLGKIDFAIAAKKQKGELYQEKQFLLWAEAKKGTNQNIEDSLVQLIFTIGKDRTFEKHIPPKFLGAFDAEKIVFILYHKLQDVFYQNDFDWTVPPSDHNTKEFKQLKELVFNEIHHNEIEQYFFYYSTQQKELQQFIKKNFVVGETTVSQIEITKNNFIYIYHDWCKQVKPTISIDWEEWKKHGLLDADFFLADILSDNNRYIMDKLKVLLQSNKYSLGKEMVHGIFMESTAEFKDGMTAHRNFWAKYKRPPREEFWSFFIERRDLLVPQEIRERKGAFFTPQKWVKLSQEYIAKTLGENWQEEYYVWDCCAGTGNLLYGLTESERIFASTLDDADVKVMKELSQQRKNNLLEGNIFQFDFLNDELPDTQGEKRSWESFKLPKKLYDILTNDKEREKLLIYINPPYAEVSGVTKGKKGVNLSKIHAKYTKELGTAGREVYTQFLLRIYNEIPMLHLAEFSKLKILQGAAFKKMRDIFLAELQSMFVCPADTFDNVTGQFPIGFKIWNTSKKIPFKSIIADVYDAQANFNGNKTFALTNKPYLTKWVVDWQSSFKDNIGFLGGTNSNDFQANLRTYLLNRKEQMGNPRGRYVNSYNLIQVCVYLAVRLCIEATWLNDRDQFLYPNDGWQNDYDFQADCLAYTLFHGQNRISSQAQTIKSKTSENTTFINHWIPFSEKEIGVSTSFDSHFMINFLKGKYELTANPTNQQDLFKNDTSNTSTLTNNLALLNHQPIVFSAEAQKVMDAGKALFTYYHQQAKNDTNYAVNASFYDIRLFFQGTNDKGKMNPKSEDEKYTNLIATLRSAQKVLAEKIAVKVYQYGFLLDTTVEE